MSKETYKTISLYTAGAILALFVVGTLLMTLSTSSLPRFFIVESGSMSPAISPGALVVSQQSKSYKVGDSITFTKPSTTGESVTHRIVKIAPNAQFVTQGDANNAPDLALVDRGHIIGKTVIAIPFLGFVVGFARSLPGLILLLFLPAGLFIFGELQTIVKEVKRLTQTKKTIIQPFTS